MVVRVDDKNGGQPRDVTTLLPIVAGVDQRASRSSSSSSSSAGVSAASEVAPSTSPASCSGSASAVSVSISESGKTAPMTDFLLPSRSEVRRAGKEGCYEW